MTPNLQIELRRFISSNVVSKLNKFYFENDALLIKGIDVSIGTVLMGLYNRWGVDTSDAADDQINV